jgi:hypothetical protein
VSKHIIFFVAGIGDEAKNWSVKLRKSFQELFDSYPLPPGGLPFDELFETEEIFYNDFFDEWRKRVANEAGKALNMFGAEGLPSDTVKKLLEAGVAAGGGGFFRTHAFDALQYRFLALVSQSIRDTLQHQIMSRLAESEFGTPVRWSIIAHSLGTSIVHDTLHQMFKPGPGAEESALFQPFAVVMLSNVSQLLHNPKVLGDGVDAFGSFVRPNRNPESGACRNYLSAANEFDPIARAGDFDPPPNWLTPDAQTQRRFRPLKFKAIPKSRNVHGYEEYLAHPAVHVPLFRILSGDPDRISDAQENEAHKAYETANPLPSFDDVKRIAIEKLGERAGKNDWFERIMAWKDVLESFTKK